MDLPAIGETPGCVELDQRARVLRSRWRTASLTAGWRFPSDWALPEVDAVCAEAVAAGNTLSADGPTVALAGLARARAAAGGGLSETFTDAAALHAVLARLDSGDGFVAADADALPARLVRIVALGWADVALDKLAHMEVADSLTGLATLPYLRTRLTELYRAAEAEPAQDGSVRPGRCPDYSLVVVQLDFSAAAGWSRLTAMIVAADALRGAFDRGESLAAIGPSTVAALVPRDGRLAARTLELRTALVRRLASDPQLADLGSPRIRIVRLPATYDAACELLDQNGST